MQVTVRKASHADIEVLVDLYEAMEAEQVSRKPIWALIDGLDKPFRETLSQMISSDDVWLHVGEIDGAPVGFISASVRGTLSRSHGLRIGTIDLIYTDPDARGVGVGDHMLEDVLADLREMGITHFDAPVGPGQRLTKNFFEGHEFAARSLVMHHSDDPETVRSDVEPT
ncbi:MAG: GNAT family N-acetyltransferase [Acidimicrobiia bacterium]|nr:GNAT family N-acetyltransferase [Acidimicrobiia bacterium]